MRDNLGWNEGVTIDKGDNFTFITKYKTME